MKPVFQTRAFGLELASLPVDYKVIRYSWNVIGGPEFATIEASGKEIDLWDLVERLRCPVTIYSDKGNALWWGYVAEISLQVGQLAVGVSIDTMANRIAVAYAEVGLGEESSGSRQTTDWAEDADSITEYGIKELLQSVSGGTDAYADAALAMLLASRKYPQPNIRLATGGAKTATITCRGWWDTLAWKYAPVPTRLAYAYYPPGSLLGWTTNAPIGRDDDDDIQALAQSIAVGPTALNVQQVAIRVDKVGAPSDNLRIALWTNPDDAAPGTELASKTIAGSAIGTTPAWITVSLDDAIELTEETSVFIVVDRTGTLDADNYYRLYLDVTGQYELGLMLQKAADTWSAGPAMDMPFMLYTNDIIETSQQVRSLASQFGQFLSAVDLDVASGISTESYRDGDATARFEMEELLKMGTSNYRRMLASIDAGRRLRIYEEPASASPWLLSREGKLSDSLDNDIDRETCPVGMWARLKDVIPGSVDITKLSDPSLVFIDQAEYTVETDELVPTPRNIENPWDIGRPLDG